MNRLTGDQIVLSEGIMHPERRHSSGDRNYTLLIATVYAIKLVFSVCLAVNSNRNGIEQEDTIMWADKLSWRSAQCAGESAEVVRLRARDIFV